MLLFSLMCLLVYIYQTFFLSLTCLKWLIDINDVSLWHLCNVAKPEWSDNLQLSATSCNNSKTNPELLPVNPKLDLKTYPLSHHTVDLERDLLENFETCSYLMLISLTGIVSPGLSSFPVWIRTRSSERRSFSIISPTPFSRVQTPNSADVLFHLLFPPNPLAGLWIGAAGRWSCWRRIISKTMLQTNERTCWPSVAGFFLPVYILAFALLHLAALWYASWNCWDTWIKAMTQQNACDRW